MVMKEVLQYFSKGVAKMEQVFGTNQGRVGNFPSRISDLKMGRRLVM